jgi:putative serine protease PepD
MSEQQNHPQPTPYGDDHPTSPLPFFTGGPGEPPPVSAPPSHGRRGLTAGVLVAALLVGGAGGVAGAAGYSSLTDGSGSAAGGASTPLQTAAPASAPTTTRGTAQSVAQQVLPSVVKIDAQSPTGSAGSGSGIILSADGEILTNNHVAALGANGGRLIVSFNDGSAARATIVGTDPVSDLAVLQAQGVSGLKPATLGDSDALKVGDQVVAIGSPFGLEATVTSGIVSSLNRPVSVSGDTSGTDTTYPAIQTDAAINPGNSGGPLVNMAGQVVGIDSSIRTSSSTLGGEGGSIGLGFAIPISKVLPIVQQLRDGQTPTHARLGVTVSNSTARDGLITGAGIGTVNAGSAAAAAGLQKGDVVTKIDGQPITGSESMVATVRGYRPGDKVSLTVLRNGRTLHLSATLESDAAGTSS